MLGKEEKRRKLSNSALINNWHEYIRDAGIADRHAAVAVTPAWPKGRGNKDEIKEFL
jgi:hypothetical protein